MGYLKTSEILRVPDYHTMRHISSGSLGFDYGKCVSCGICSRICPARSIVMEKPARPGRGGSMPRLSEIFPGIPVCVACGCCVAACPQGVIRIIRGFRAQCLYRKLSQSVEFSLPQKY